MFKKWVKKAFKSMKKVLKNPGRALKKGLGKVGKAFGKLGPIGTLALTLMMPGLGAMAASFGTWAAGLSGTVGTVMQGIAAAGKAIGTVYNSVTNLVSGTLNGITGGTFKGEMIKGPDGTLIKNTAYKAGGSDKLAAWVGKRADDFRMKVGLPTSNITPKTAMADASKLGEDLASKGFDGSTFGKNGRSGLFSAKETGLEIIKTDSLLTPKGPLTTTDAITGEISIGKVSTPTSLKVGDISIDPMKPNLDAIKQATISGGEYTDVIVGFEPKTSYIGNNDIELNSLTPKTIKVPKGTLTKDQLYQNNRLVSYQQNLTRTNAKYIDMVANKPDATNFDIMRSEATDLGKFATGAVAVSGKGGQEEQQNTSTPVLITDMPTDVTTANDYTRTYAAQYAGLGIQGLPNFQNFAEAGFYGGDPYSFASAMRANSVAIPQATVPRVS